jgi:hypothetical protein
LEETRRIIAAKAARGGEKNLMIATAARRVLDSKPPLLSHLQGATQAIFPPETHETNTG